MRLAALFLLAPALTAQALPEGLTAHLKATSILHADFTQTRTLAALSRPLKSSGTLVIAKERGVIWNLARPMPLTVVAGPRGIMEVDREGRRKVQTSQDTPMVARMAGIMKSLLEGQWSALEGLFSVRGEAGKDGAWAITLTPNAQTAAFLKTVRIKGGRHIDTIHVEEPSGDTMDLRFLNFRDEAPLTDDEKRLLAFE